MADKISVSYDANIDEFKRKLDELIQKNLLLKGAVDDATKSLTAMGQVVDGQAKKVTINIKNTQDYRTILNEVNKVVNDSRQIIKAATEATEQNTKAQNDNAQATQRAGTAKKAKTDVVVANSKAVQDNSIKLTQNNTVHNNHSKTLDQSVKNVTNLNTKLVENNKHIQDNRTYVKNITDSYNRYVNGVGQASNSTNGLSGVLGQLQSRLIAAFSIQSLWQFGESVVDTTRKVELMQNRLSFVFGSVTGGREAFDRLYDTSQKLGIGFQELGDGFSSFAIAAKMAGFSAKESEGMFTKVAIALRGAGANSLQTQRSFYALQQMLSKGVVAAEELRRQLGEALPGASDLMTKAYNRLHPAQQVTNLGFTKLLENGKIISAEILPEFARVLEETFAPAVAGKSGSLDASLTRVTNSWERFKLSLGEANFQTIISFTTELTEAIDLLNLSLTNERLSLLERIAIAFDGIFNPGKKDLFTAQLYTEKVLNQELRKRQSIVYALSGEYENIGDASKATAIKVEMLNEKAASSQAEFNRLTLEQLEEKRESIAAELKDTEHLLSLGKAGTDQLRVKGKAYQIILDRMEEIRIKNKETEKQEGDAIAAAKERVALEETRLLKTTEGTTAYYNQLIKVIQARKDLVKLEKAGTPNQMGLDLAKLDKDLEKARKMIGSFDPNVAEVIEEGVYEAPVDALQKLDKEIRKQREDELELAIVTAKNLVETTEKGTQARANAEQWLALQVAELEKFKVRISTDSEELKAEKIALINESLKNQLKNINKEIVDDSVASNEKIVELIQKANDLIEKTQLDTYRRRRAIVKQQFEAMANDIKEAMSKTGDFEALAQLAKALSGVEQAGKSAISSLDLNQVGEVINEIGGLYSSVANIQSTLLNNEAIMLKRQLDQKLISEEEYNMKSLQLEKKRFEQEKQVATLEATINAASGIVKAVATGKFWQAALITATLAAQIAAIQSQQFPGFKDGVIDINGPGTGTSDSIPARLSRGESVMTAEETKRYKPVLQAIRDNNFEEFVSKRYIDAMGSQNASSAVGNSFAENLTNSFDLQTAELAHLLKQNRKVAIKNVDEIARAMRRESTSAKVINRRRFK